MKVNRISFGQNRSSQQQASGAKTPNLPPTNHTKVNLGAKFPNKGNNSSLLQSLLKLIKRK